jgi:hypothetical protein
MKDTGGLSFCGTGLAGRRLYYVANILARYCERELPLARIWLRSWRARGWTTGVRFGAGISFRVINFSLPRRGAPEKLSTKRFGARGWEKAPLVKFPPGATEETVLNCGRAL